MSGIFGVVSKENCLSELFYGTDYHSHLGTEFGGIAVLDGSFKRQIHNISQTQFKSRFYEDCKFIEGKKGIGVISDFDEQPIYLNSHLGEFCLVTNGFIENAEELSEQLLKDGASFSEFSKAVVNNTELVAKIINKGRTIVEGIEKVYDFIEGSCSMLLMNSEGIYAARDRCGYTPLVVGKKESGTAVTTETSAFPNNDFQIAKYLEPGEVVLLTEDGLIEKRPGGSVKQVCSFLWIYTGFPASNYEGMNVEIARERCGRFLAMRDTDIEVDLVCGVPDSGLAHAIGYASESGKVYRRPLVKYTPGYGRSYTPSSQHRRDLIARMKIIPIEDIIRGNRIVVCEDSIVRGTQLRNFTVRKLWQAGAKEVHIRVACPPLMFPCKFNLSTRSIGELAARRAIKSLEGKDISDVADYLNPDSPKYKKMVDWIAKDLEVTTLRYQTIDDMHKAIGIPKEKLCFYCWNGRYPVQECGKNCMNCRVSSKTG